MSLTLPVIFRFAHGSDDIGSICQTLWNADSNSLVNGVDFQLNLQNQLGYSNRYDMASRKLFLRVNKQKLKSPTFVAFKGKNRFRFKYIFYSYNFGSR